MPHLIKPACHTILSILLRSSANLLEARRFHGPLLVNGVIPSSCRTDLGSLLVSTDAAFGTLPDALNHFNRFSNKNAFSWNVILKKLVDAGQFSVAIESYQLMIREGFIPDNYTYPLALRACSGLQSLEQGRKILESIRYNEINHKIKPNVFVECATIDMFAKCGSLREARRVFDGMSSRDLVSWTAMICGAVQSGEWCEALNLYRRMRLEGYVTDSVIIATVLPACSRLGALPLGMGFHAFSVRSGADNDLCVSNAFIDMYCKCGNTHEAGRMFHFMEHRDVISWSSLIAGYSQNCEYHESIALCVEMKEAGVEPSSVTFAGVLPALANLRLLRQGKEIHNFVMRHNVKFDGFIASALIDLYAKCGSMTEAEAIFERNSDAEVGIWNSMIAAYAMDQDAESAFRILRRMGESRFKPNSITMMSILPLCTRLGMLNLGKQIHGYVVRNGLGCIVSVSNPLIDMYSKCGNSDLGIRVIEQMTEKDIVSYNTIISALGMHGDGLRAFSFFGQMMDEGILPNKVTFLAVLAACSHAGLCDRAWSFYNMMIVEYEIMPEMEHYSCMVDILGRSGCLDDAWEFIKMMPIDPGIDVLGSLLGACRVHKRVELAEIVGERIFAKNPDDPGYYILLSNIYATDGRWQDMMKIRSKVKERGLVKKPGHSWIQIGCSVHTFLARDRFHPQINRIHEVLNDLVILMKDEGYFPDTSFFIDLGGDDGELMPLQKNWGSV